MKNASNHYDVIVIGGGASGMFAAGRAAELGKRVLLLEKNKQLGEKLKISGGGRCNITNATYDTRALLANYGDASPFLFSPFSKFGVKDTFTFFESRGLPLVVQARNRAFPSTEKSVDVIRTLDGYLRKGNVEIKSGITVKRLTKHDGLVSGVETPAGVFTAETYVLATGGVSHPETGSTGDGFKWLADLGHTIKQPTPTIVPLAVAEEWVHMLSGVSLSFMKITFFLEDKKQFSKTGKILFTHFGLSGPLILNSAGKVGDLLQEGRVSARIDAYPDTEIGALDAQITKHFDANKNKMLKNILKEIVPEGMAPGIAQLLTAINLDTKVHSITKAERRIIVDTLKALPVTITNLMGYDRAVVADGGLSLSEIDTKTMRSKITPNLAVTGDLLHINRPSGGYSLQLCWTSGWVAGSNA
ncbi:MAG: aminoacetone oxidase family FAD-binding enzyme [bacterium]